MDYYLVMKKLWNVVINDNIDLEKIMLSEISQTEKDKYYILSLTCGI